MFKVNQHYRSSIKLALDFRGLLNLIAEHQMYKICILWILKDEKDKKNKNKKLVMCSLVDLFKKEKFINWFNRHARSNDFSLNKIIK